MNRRFSSRTHGRICWSLIAGSWAAIAAANYQAIVIFERNMAERGHAIPTTAPQAPPGLIAISCGVVALLLAICLSRRGRAWLRIRPRLSRPSAHGDTYLEAFTLRIGAASLGVAAFQFAWDWTPLVNLGMFGSLLAALYAFVRCRSIRVPLAEWGWRRGRVTCREVSLGVFVGLFVAPISYLPGALLLSVDIDLFLFSMSSLDVLRALIWAPIVEETLYRGMLYRYLRDRWRWPVAVLISAAVFGALHFPFSRWFHAFGVGIVCALLREWRGSLLAPIAAHATWNLLATLVRSGVIAPVL